WVVSRVHAASPDVTAYPRGGWANVGDLRGRERTTGRRCHAWFRLTRGAWVIFRIHHGRVTYGLSGIEPLGSIPVTSMRPSAAISTANHSGSWFSSLV